MANRALTVLAIVVFVGAIAGVYLIRNIPTAISDEQAVRALVEHFGTKLQNVSLLAPEETLRADMQSQYAPFVSGALLESWQNDPMTAPGRMTSSPWPARIEIERISRNEAGTYDVQGHIIEVTNEGGGIGEIPAEAARRPVTLVASKEGDRWKISSLTLGAYPGDGEWEYSQPSAQGIQFQYPKKLPTTYITAPKWPPLVEFTVNEYECEEGQITATDGPILTFTKRMVDDREYCVATSSEGAAGSVFHNYEYVTKQGDFTVRAVFTLRFPQCANYPDTQRRECEAEQANFDIDGLVDRMTQSIRML